MPDSLSLALNASERTPACVPSASSSPPSIDAVGGLFSSNVISAPLMSRTLRLLGLQPVPVWIPQFRNNANTLVLAGRSATNGVVSVSPPGGQKSPTAAWFVTPSLNCVTTFKGDSVPASLATSHSRTRRIAIAGGEL